MKRRWRFIFLLAAVLMFASRTLWNSHKITDQKWFTDSSVVGLFRPVGSAFSNLSQYLSSSFRKYFFLVDVAEKNRQLIDEIQGLKMQNFSLREQLLIKSGYEKVTGSYPFEMKLLMPAKILSYDLFYGSKTILIDKGVVDGVKINNTVLSGEGLVGRIIETYKRASKVLLLIDPNFAVDASNRRTGLRTLVSGMNDHQLDAKRRPFLTQLEYLQNAKEMLPGDALVTSGLGGVFPEGIPIGVVDKVSYSKKNLFDKAWVLPAVDFTKSARVYVLLENRELKAKDLVP